MTSDVFKVINTVNMNNTPNSTTSSTWGKGELYSSAQIVAMETPICLMPQVVLSQFLPKSTTTESVAPQCMKR